MTNAAIRLQGVSRWYGPPESRVHALDDLTLDIAEKDFVAVTGPSGCGKSTLMHLLGGLDTPSAGEIFVGDLPLHAADERALTTLPPPRPGHRVPVLQPAADHERARKRQPAAAAGGRAAVENARPKAMELLDLVGMTPRAGHFVHQLSGGEMQRTAIARALIHRPRLLLADEPTGNLDSAGAARVLEVLREVATQALTTLVVVTHSEEVARTANRRIRLKDGRLDGTL